MKRAFFLTGGFLFAALVTILLLRSGAPVSPSPQFVSVAPTPAPVLPPLHPAPAKLPPLMENTSLARYRIVALPIAFTASAINAKGEVAGTLTVSNRAGSTRAMVWANGKRHDLPSLDAMRTTQATCISDCGITGGTAEAAYGGAISTFQSTTVLWNARAKKPVPRPIGNYSFASLLAVNGYGQAVGFSEAASGMEQEEAHYAFFWDGSKIIELGNAAACLAYGINERGQVVGTENSKMILWQEGEKHVLGDGVAYAINNRGQIAGTSDFGRKAKVTLPPGFRVWQDGSATAVFSQTSLNRSSLATESQTIFYPMTHALLYEKGKARDLGVLPGQYFSTVSGLNDRGQIVGSCTRQNSFDYGFDTKQNRAFLWQAGRMTDLNILLPKNSGWNLHSASGINNKGQIIGTGALNGRERSFLLTPVR